MQLKNDPVLFLFEQRNSPEKLKAYLADEMIYPSKKSLMPKEQREAQELKDARKKANKKQTYDLLRFIDANQNILSNRFEMIFYKAL